MLFLPSDPLAFVTFVAVVAVVGVVGVVASTFHPQLLGCNCSSICRACSISHFKPSAELKCKLKKMRRIAEAIRNRNKGRRAIQPPILPSRNIEINETEIKRERERERERETESLLVQFVWIDSN